MEIKRAKAREQFSTRSDRVRCRRHASEPLTKKLKKSDFQLDARSLICVARVEVPVVSETSPRLNLKVS